jgi:hypothetical protein
MARPIIKKGWPLEAFIGDIVVCTLEGENLDQTTGFKVEPAGKGIVITIGDLYQKTTLPQQSSTALTITVAVDVKTYPGEKRIIVISEDGESEPLPFLVMM